MLPKMLTEYAQMGLELALISRPRILPMGTRVSTIKLTAARVNPILSASSVREKPFAANRIKSSATAAIEVPVRT